jgi:hypothetical protein
VNFLEMTISILVMPWDHSGTLNNPPYFSHAISVSIAFKVCGALNNKHKKSMTTIISYTLASQLPQRRMERGLITATQWDGIGEPLKTRRNSLTQGRETVCDCVWSWNPNTYGTPSIITGCDDPNKENFIFIPLRPCDTGEEVVLIFLKPILCVCKNHIVSILKL